MPPAPRPKTTTFCLIACDVPVALVMRRGPTRHTQLLRWDLRTDALEPGQWLVGTLEHRGCGLSPDGELFVYAARKGPKSFTAISRPPYFTALAYWEQKLPWSGGGFFTSPDSVVLGVTHAPDDGKLPGRLRIQDVWSYFPWSGNGRSRQTFGDAVRAAPEAFHGWTLCKKGWHRQHPTRLGLWLERESPPGRAGPCRVFEDAGGRARDLGVLDWVEWEPNGSLLFGRGGVLCRQPVPKAIDAAWSPAVEIADLSSNAFQPVIAPKSARRWPARLEVAGKPARR